MGFLSKVLGGERECENCTRVARLGRVVLPDRTAIWLCPQCQAEADEVYLNPLRDFEFGRMVDELRFRRDSVWGIPWGSSRQAVLAGVPDEYRDEFGESQSRSMVRCETVFLAGHRGALTFTFDDHGALNEVFLAPRKAVFDAVAPLVERFGQPIARAPGFEAGELRLIWHGEGLEFDLSSPPKQVVSLAVRRTARW